MGGESGGSNRIQIWGKGIETGWRYNAARDTDLRRVGAGGGIMAEYCWRAGFGKVELRWLDDGEKRLDRWDRMECGEFI